MVAAAEKISTVVAHMGISFGVMYVATGSMAFGGVAAVIEPVCTVLLMPFHEKMWERIREKFEQRDNTKQKLIPVPVR
jgi:uncharacterized membrane protein